MKQQQTRNYQNIEMLTLKYTILFLKSIQKTQITMINLSYYKFYQKIIFISKFQNKHIQMADKLANKVLGGITAAGSLVASIFLSPPKYVWGLSGLVIAAASLGVILKHHWVQSQPNQWLLVIRNGTLIKAGVGLKTFVGIADTVVRFPSRVQRVEFQANNVTKQMQGVVITGFAFWSVFRDDEGPFRCYKYMEGGDANSNVRAMCQSVLRNLIANSSLEQVLRNRNHLRDHMKTDLKDQFKGWGIWLETVQITEVTISSNKLFTDLQAEFRQDTRLKAEKIDLTTKQAITKQRNQSDMKIAEIQEVNTTKREQTKNNESLKRANQQATYDQKKNELQLKRLQRQKDFQIQKLKTDLEQQTKRLQNQNAIKTEKQNFQLQYQKKILEVDRLHDEKTLQKYQIDSMERIYNRLGIKQVRINQFVGANNQNGLASILPSLGMNLNQGGN